MGDIGDSAGKRREIVYRAGDTEAIRFQRRKAVLSPTTYSHLQIGCPFSYLHKSIIAI